MESIFVKAYLEIDCQWEGLEPAYRVYVDDELFTERTWRWNDAYIKETLQILAAPGQYKIRLEPVKPTLAQFTVFNHGVDVGPAEWIDSDTLSIRDPA